MEGEEGSRKAGDLSDNPLLAHLVIVKMEEIMDKLKLLDYETGFCKKLKFKPFPRHYFALPTNSGEQFFAFTNLAVWLINLNGKKLEQPQEYDDPNATITTIITEGKKLGIPTNFPPAKLKSGAGEHVCNILDGLAECALAVTGFAWKRPVHADEDVGEELIQEESSELKLDEELVEEDSADSEEEGPMFLDLGTLQQSKANESEAGQLGEALESTTDAQEWRLEVERVLPALKIHVRHDNRDWRAHYEQMHTHKDGIDATLSDTKVYLDKLHQEISKTLEKVASREKYINNQLEHHIQEFRSAQDRLAEVRDKYKDGSSGVNDLTRELAQVTEELEGVKAQMDEKGTSMTDAGPLVRVKQALTRLKNECTQMDVRIGVVEHTLLEAKFKNKTAIKRQMNETGDAVLF